MVEWKSIVVQEKCIFHHTIVWVVLTWCRTRRADPISGSLARACYGWLDSANHSPTEALRSFPQSRLRWSRSYLVPLSAKQAGARMRAPFKESPENYRTPVYHCHHESIPLSLPTNQTISATLLWLKISIIGTMWYITSSSSLIYS